jgi:hypothetical protein
MQDILPTMGTNDLIHRKTIDHPRGNAAWILFAVVSFGLEIVIGCDTHRQSVDAAKPGEAQPLFKPEAATLAQQKMCDDQAAKKFHDNESTSLHVGDKPLYSYTSHYDPTVNICYVRVHTFGGTPPSVSDVVYDAFGGRVYASYFWINSQNKKYWEVSPTECDINIPGKPEQKCTTDTEFDELTEKYFGVTIG